MLTVVSLPILVFALTKKLGANVATIATLVAFFVALIGTMIIGSAIPWPMQVSDVKEVTDVTATDDQTYSFVVDLGEGRSQKDYVYDTIVVVREDRPDVVLIQYREKSPSWAKLFLFDMSFSRNDSELHVPLDWQRP